jgi:hypothetical protein
MSESLNASFVHEAVSHNFWGLLISAEFFASEFVHAETVFNPSLEIQHRYEM